ncbi:LPS translocon maturation chaperone LptM [Marinobacter confluentis]|uniref:Lipopeptide n=1 Tax=Marinobacter confluentis TaxID=1697557 RepID=A0A4Z1BU40_9GAMM|nr:lipoprotein [Marinobacter confluentis]TGN38037.1 hypothetical protein E5Q11_16785 [Marinobacter confluentis]
MKAALITTFFLLLAAAGLAGCGQKGPLYQDEGENTASDLQGSADSKVSRDSTDDR